jgi:hypothetical protein
VEIALDEVISENNSEFGPPWEGGGIGEPPKEAGTALVSVLSCTLVDQE